MYSHMKKYIYGLSLLTLTFSAQSCLMEEEDLFSESATERLENKKVEAFNALFDSQAGWVMSYFPTVEGSVIGCPFLVKFNRSGEDGTALFAVQNDSVGTGKYMVNDAPTPFDIVFDNGPVLTFNSYNDIFHAFSDPKETDWSFDQGMGIGLGGDYEFIIIDVTPDEVLLKGKKRGTYTVLRKFDTTETGEITSEKLGELWRKYMTDLESLNKQLYKSNPAPLRLVSANGTEYYLYNGDSYIFDVVSVAENDLAYATQSKYVQTLDGLRFISEPSVEGDNGEDIIIGGKDYFFNEDKTKMVCSDGSYIDGGDPVQVFINALKDVNVVTGKPANDWVLDNNSYGSDLKVVYDKIAAKFPAYKFEFRFTANLNGQILLLKLMTSSSTTEVWRVLSPSAKDGLLSLTAGDYKSSNYDKLVAGTPEIGQFFDAFGGKLYKAAPAAAFNMGTLNLEADGNANMSFSVINTK